MEFEKIFLLLCLGLVRANILNENYHVFENKNFGSARRIILKADIPNTIKSTECLIECNKRYSCLTAYFKRNSDSSSLCELLFTPHNLTNALVTSTDSTIYQKKIPNNYIGSIILNSEPKATVLYWKRESKFFMVKYSIDNGISWNKTDNAFRVADSFNRNSTINSLNAVDIEQCENFCLNDSNCFHFTFINPLCELKSFQPNTLAMNTCSIGQCFSLVATNETYGNIYEYIRYASEAAYVTKIAFYSDENSILSDWYTA